MEVAPLRRPAENATIKAATEHLTATGVGNHGGSVPGQRRVQMTELPSGEIVMYKRDDGRPALEVRLDADTVWLSRQQIADLLQTSRTNIVEHIRNVYAEGELEEAATCREFRQVRTEGARQVARELPFYNLDLIISVGYRVKSRVATPFRIWATERLREYLVKGFTMDDAKLKNLGGEQPRRAEVTIAKNYRSEDELKRLNTLVSAYFDAAEFRVQNHEPTYMMDWLAHLDRLITAMEAPTLTGAGSVSHKQAVAKAQGEYDKYRAQLDAAPSDAETAYLESLKRSQREIEGEERP